LLLAADDYGVSLEDDSLGIVGGGHPHGADQRAENPESRAPAHYINVGDIDLAEPMRRGARRAPLFRISRHDLPAAA